MSGPRNLGSLGGFVEDVPVPDNGSALARALGNRRVD